MSETVHVCYLTDDTVVEEAHTADRVTFQHWDSGRAIVHLYRDGQLTEWITYRRAERLHRIKEAT